MRALKSHFAALVAMLYFFDCLPSKAADDPPTSPVTVQFDACISGQEVFVQNGNTTGRFDVLSYDGKNRISFQISSTLTSRGVSAFYRNGGWIVEFSGIASDFPLMYVSSSNNPYLVKIDFHPEGFGDPHHVIVDLIVIYAIKGPGPAHEA